MRKVSFLVIIGLCFVTVGGIHAQHKKSLLDDMSEKIMVAPTAEQAMRVRKSVTAGAAWLLGEAEGNRMTSLFVPPKRQYREIDPKIVNVYYRKAIRKVPVYDFKEVESMVRNNYGEMVSVKRRIPTKQIGTRDEEYLVQDDNGDIVKQRRLVNAWDKEDIVGPAFYYAGVLGQNGLCLYALHQAGVPADFDPLPRTVDSLVFHLNEFGLPDRTWDLAWLTAGFVNLPKGNEDVEKLKISLVNKLLLAQIDSGSGKGMWGPFCVNQKVVAVMMEYEQKQYGKKLAKLRAKLSMNPDSSSVQRQLDQLDENQELFANQYKGYTRTWIRPNPEKIVVKMGDENDIDRWIRVRGMPHFLYGEVLGDLETTRLALFALNEAKKNGCLPQKTIMPKNSQKRELLPSLRTSTIIADAVKAVSAVGGRQASWNEANSCSVVTAFDRLGFAGLPVKESYLPKLKSKTTTKCSVDGYAALRSLSSLGGRSIPQHQLRATVLKLNSAIPEYLRNGSAGGDEVNAPYKMAVALAGFPDPSPSVSSAMIEYLLSAEAGCWGKNSKYLDNTPSLVSFLELTSKRLFEKWHTYQPERYPVFNAETAKTIHTYRKINYSRWISDQIFCTGAAVAYLSGALQTPAVGVWQMKSQGKVDVSQKCSGMLKRVLQTIRQSARLKMPLRQNAVSEDLSDLSLDLPVLCVIGQGSFMPSGDAEESLGDYLRAGGLLVNIATGTAAELAFMDGLEKAVLRMLSGSKIKQFKVAAGRATVKTVVREDGTVAMVSIPVGAESSASVGRSMLPGKAALPLMSEIVKARLGPQRLNEQTAVDFARLSEIQQQALEEEAE